MSIGADSLSLPAFYGTSDARQATSSYDSGQATDAHIVQRGAEVVSSCSSPHFVYFLVVGRLGGEPVDSTLICAPHNNHSRAMGIPLARATCLPPFSHKRLPVFHE